MTTTPQALAERIERLEAACWSVIAYDQLLRTIAGPQVLLAGDMPDVDATYDSMVKQVVDAMAGRAALASIATPPAPECDLCAGKCRGHSLADEATWEPEPGSREYVAQHPPAQDDGLVERLRLHRSWRDSHGELNSAPNEAAAHIEHLTARLATAGTFADGVEAAAKELDLAAKLAGPGPYLSLDVPIRKQCLRDAADMLRHILALTPTEQQGR